MKIIINEVGSIVASFDGLADVVFDPAKVNADIGESAKVLGLTNKLRDSAAISRTKVETIKGKKVETVITVTDAMRREAYVKMAEALVKPNATWSVRTMKARTLIPALVALAEKTGRPYAELEAQFIAKMETELANIS